MLHRSFKPAKCKTSLKLATSRLKLMKNKKGVQLNQMKRDLAQLLESGQDQTARIRVEHVIREEKTIAAYELLELYCELIAARLPIIESQKNCPIDLKEAITSVIFASPRCADITELVDIRKHLTAKYGKEFITAAIELRPNCGVSRMLVEKLSAIAPDGPTKMKILNAIAEEHNIQWEPKAFGEKDAAPPDDLLNGPTTFENASTTVVEPPKFQAPPSQDQKRDEPLNFSEHNIRPSLGSQNSASTDTGGIKTTSDTYHPDARHSGMGSERMFARQSFAEDGNASSFGRQNWNMEFKDATAAAQAAAESAERASMAARAAAELSSQAKISRQYSSESQKLNIPSVRDERPGKYASSSSTGEHDAVNNSFHDRNPRITRQYSSESQKSNIHSLRDETTGTYTASNLTGQHRGKDAANHSHDRNPKITRQYSSESVKSNIHDSIDERPEKHAASKLTGEHPAKDSVNNSSHDGNPKLQYEQTDENEYDNLEGDVEKSHWDGRGSTKRSSRSASLRSSKASIDEDALVNSIQKGERYSRKSSFEKDAFKDERGPFSSEVSMKKHSRESEVEFVSDQKDGFNSENLDYFGEERIRKQFSAGYSRSHSSTSSENYNVSNSTHQNFGYDAAENPFVGIDEGNVHTDTKKTNSYDDAVAFDESSSDGDGSGFDIGPEYDEAESTSYFPSPGKKPPTHPSTNADAWGPRRNVSKSNSQTHFSPEWHTPLEISESSTRSANPSQSENFVPLTFDDSDGPKFDSEDELEKSRSSEIMDSSILPRKQNVFSINSELTQSESRGLAGSSFAARENSESVRRPWLSSSSDDLDSMEVQPKNNRGTDDLGESLASPPFSSLGKSRVELSDIGSESYLDYSVDKENHMQTSRRSLIHNKDNVHTPESPDSESGKELNFGMLRGGLRHKGYRLPMYTGGPSDDSSSSSKKAAEESSKPIEQTSPPIVRSSFNSRVSRYVDEKSSSGAPITHSDSDSDDSREELGEQTLSSRKEPYAQKASKEVNRKSIFGPPVTYFDPDSGDDSEEHLPKQTISNRGRLGSGLSRRTKASPSNPEKSSYSRDQVRSEASRKTKASPSNSETSSNSRNRVGSEASVDSNSGPERKPTRTSYGAETQPKPRSGRRGNIEQPSSEKRASSKPMQESDIPSREGSLKASAVEQPSSPLRKTVSASNSTGNPKKSSVSGATSTGENSAKNASHVHPKLPDYDTIKAHLQSLRSDRQ